MSFEIKRNSVDKEYLKMTVLENVTVGLFTLDTFLDLTESKGSQIEDVMENLVEQINYLKGITSKTYVQQLPEIIQDQLVQARNFLVQASYRYTYLSQGRQSKPELMVGKEEDITWDTTKQLAEIGLAKYLFTISLLFNELYNNEKEILESLTEDQQEKIRRFIETKNEDADIFEDSAYMTANYSEMLHVNFNAEEEGEESEDDEDEVVSFDAFEDND